MNVVLGAIGSVSLTQHSGGAGPGVVGHTSQPGNVTGYDMVVVL